jgi:hypothetical protein
MSFEKSISEQSFCKRDIQRFNMLDAEPEYPAAKSPGWCLLRSLSHNAEHAIRYYNIEFERKIAKSMNQASYFRPQLLFCLVRLFYIPRSTSVKVKLEIE